MGLACPPSTSTARVAHGHPYARRLPMRAGAAPAAIGLASRVVLVLRPADAGPESSAISSITRRPVAQLRAKSPSRIGPSSSATGRLGWTGSLPPWPHLLGLRARRHES